MLLYYYYYCFCLVLRVELHFVDLATVLRGDRIALGLGEFPIQHRAEGAGHIRHRRSATVNFDIHQIRPLDFVFNLHANSLRPRPHIVNIF